jgi:hypothetical protein
MGKAGPGKRGTANTQIEICVREAKGTANRSCFASPEAYLADRMSATVKEMALACILAIPSTHPPPLPPPPAPPCQNLRVLPRGKKPPDCMGRDPTIA